jgi:hypothetical protein
MTRLRLTSRFSGSHFAYFDDEGRLTVEWYDFGPHAPYESANMLIFELGQQSLLADALGLPSTERSKMQLLAALHDRFPSYFDVKEFCEKEGLQFTNKVDFWP